MAEDLSMSGRDDSVTVSRAAGGRVQVAEYFVWLLSAVLVSYVVGATIAVVGQRRRYREIGQTSNLEAGPSHERTSGSGRSIN